MGLARWGQSLFDFSLQAGELDFEFFHRLSISGIVVEILRFERVFFTIQKIPVIDVGFVVVDAVSKRLMCDDVGLGAMASVNTIVDKCFELCIDLE